MTTMLGEIKRRIDTSDDSIDMVEAFCMRDRDRRWLLERLEEAIAWLMSDPCAPRKPGGCLKLDELLASLTAPVSSHSEEQS